MHTHEYFIVDKSKHKYTQVQK